MKTFLILVVSAIGLLAVATAVMFVLKACPPQGPWLTPPWCRGSDYQIKIPKISVPSSQTTTSDFSTSSQPNPQTKSQTSQPVKAPSLPAAPYAIALTVQVPENTPNHTIIYLQIREGLNEWGRNLKMEKKAGNIWNLKADLKDYKQINPVPIIASEGFGHTYPNDALDFHLNKMKADGFKVYMMPQICCADTSKANFSKEWWDVWFNEYEKYAMYFVDKANKYNVEYLVITGDSVVVGASPDKRPADYKERLEAVYSKAKSAYKGKLGRGLFIGGEIGSKIPDIWPNTDSMPFIEQADFIGINWWVGLTDKNNPTQEELNANVKRIFDLRLKPLYEKYKKPIILQQVAYPSIDGGLTGKAGVDDAATALWEPYSDKYKLDLEEQAMGFEALMKNVAETSYVIGIYPFTYWPDDFPLTKEYNVRGKPAEEVLSQWYKSIK